MASVLSLKAQVEFIDMDKGLSNRDVICIYQTRDGFMWFGTGNGLNRYDGYHFTVYLHNREVPHTISNSKINCIYEDRKGRFWIGTDDGLNLMERYTGRFTRLPAPAGFSMESGNMGFTSIVEMADSSILVATDQGRVFHYNDSLVSKEFIRLSAPNSTINLLKIGADSSIWIMGDHTFVNKYTLKGDRDSGLNTGWIEEVRTVMPPVEDMETALYINDKLLKFDAASGSIVPDRFLDSVNAILTPVTATWAMENEELWVGGEGGELVRINLDKHIVHNFSGIIKPYLTSAVRVLYQDMTGVMWVGSNYGIVKFSPDEKLFGSILSVDPHKSIWEKNSIRGIIEDEKGDLYIGGYSGLYRYRPSTAQLKYFPMVDYRGRSFEKYHTYSLLNDSSGYIWIGSEGMGFYRLNKANGQFEFPAHRNKVNKNNIHYTYHLLWDQDGTILLATSDGVYKYDIVREHLYKIKVFPDSVAGSKTNVTDMIPTGTGEFWIGTYGAGLYRYHPQKGITAVYNTSTSPALSHNIVTDLLLDSAGVLWIGTRGGGLNRLEVNSGQVNYFTKADGLADNQVSGVEDAGSVLWISTFRGLSAYVKRSGKFENYYEKDGISDNEFNIAAHCRSATGHFYFGGLNGVNVFRTGQLERRKRKKPPLLFLTRIVRQHNDRIYDSFACIADSQPLVLAHDENYISFYFALADYFTPSDNRFLYRLEGADDSWINIENQNSLHLKGLAPGRYTLYVRGINGEGVEAANLLSIPLEVRAALYQKTWFQWMVILLALLLIYFLMRYRQIQQSRIQELRTRISSDLHDELGSILTRISIKADLIGQGLSGRNERNKELNDIAEASRLATSTMNDVLWSVDARNDKMGNLLDHMRENVSEILTPKRIDFEFIIHAIDTDKEVEMAIRQNLFLIFKEAINNIARHSDADNVEIRMENRDKHFAMIIRDNGKGGKRPSDQRGQGLKNMRMRAGNIRASLWIDKDNGYEIKLIRKRFC